MGVWKQNPQKPEKHWKLSHSSAPATMLVSTRRVSLPFCLSGVFAMWCCRNVDPPIWYDTDVKLFEIQRVWWDEMRWHHVDLSSTLTHLLISWLMNSLIDWLSYWSVDWEGRLGVLVRNLRTMRMVHWVNVSDSSGAGWPGSSWMESLYMVVVELIC